MATKSSEYDHLFKILIIGDSGVGKTTILQRFTQDYYSNEYLATIGVDYKFRTIDIDSKRCKLQVWDTAGQDRFRSIVNSYYRNAQGVLVCFDITDIHSFRNVNNWLADVKRYSPENTEVYLIGTKSDLQNLRMVTDEMIQNFIANQNLTYVETSSKNNENVEKCFTDLTRILIERSNPKQSQVIHKENTVLLNEPPKHESSGCLGENKCTI